MKATKTNNKLTLAQQLQALSEAYELDNTEYERDLLALLENNGVDLTCDFKQLEINGIGQQKMTLTDWKRENKVFTHKSAGYEQGEATGRAASS